MSVDLSAFERCEHDRPRAMCGECLEKRAASRTWIPPERLLGLNGYAKVGKDTVADLLGWTRVALADPVRESAMRIDPWVDREGYGIQRLSKIVHAIGWDAAKTIPEVRRLLQHIGTEMGRDYLSPLIGLRASMWIYIAARQISNEEDPERFVITDVRFANEVAWIQSWGGRVIRITRPGVGPVNAHVSDSAANELEVDAVLHNDGTLEELPAKLNQVLALLGWEDG